MTVLPEEQVAGVAALNDPIRRALYLYVVNSADAVGREEAAAAVGIQRALAAFHLDKLTEQGLLDVEFRRLTGRSGPGAGRPAKLYRRSPLQIEVSLPPRKYDLVGRMLAEAIEAAGRTGNPVRDEVAKVSYSIGRLLGEDVVERAGKRPSKAKQRQALLDILASYGFEPRIRSGEVVLANCPFHALAQQFRDLVCGMNLELLKGIRSVMPLDAIELQPRLEPEPGQCCVKFGSGAP
jgi:predicted ArsR family transcriptional regulator